MWFPTHIRKNVKAGAQATAGLVCCCLLTGCSSFSLSRLQFHDELADRDSDEFPVPSFLEDAPSSQIASTSAGRGLVSAPAPFRWNEAGRSAGNRTIQTATAGKSGYRILVLGSLAGNDPLALQLTERLALHVHDNSVILGGAEVTVVRSPNPDGELAGNNRNDNDARISRAFPTQRIVAISPSEVPEVGHLLQIIDRQRPQRVIHIRTHGSETGVIAASSGASKAAKDVAGWLRMNVVTLPGQSHEGTLERYISEGDDAEIITFAMPESADSATLWEEYGHSPLNLLLDDDYETRELARRKGRRSSADRRSPKRNGKAPSSREKNDY